MLFDRVPVLLAFCFAIFVQPDCSHQPHAASHFDGRANSTEVAPWDSRMLTGTSDGTDCQPEASTGRATLLSHVQVSQGTVHLNHSLDASIALAAQCSNACSTLSDRSAASTTATSASTKVIQTFLPTGADPPGSRGYTLGHVGLSTWVQMVESVTQAARSTSLALREAFPRNTLSMTRRALAAHRFARPLDGIGKRSSYDLRKRLSYDFGYIGTRSPELGSAVSTLGQLSLLAVVIAIFL